MGRWGLGLLSALAIAQSAQAQNALPGQGDRATAAANAHCATLGEGFFAVAGSSTCMRISGHISAGVGFGTAGGGGHAFGAPTTGSASEVGLSGDTRFDTPLGPGRVYVHVRNASGSRWLIDSQ